MLQCLTGPVSCRDETKQKAANQTRNRSCTLAVQCMRLQLLQLLHCSGKLPVLQCSQACCPRTLLPAAGLLPATSKWQTET